MEKVRKYFLIVILVFLSFFLGWGGKQFWNHFYNKGLVAEDSSRLSSESLTIAQRLSEAFSLIAEKASPAVVYIETERVISSPWRQFPPMEFFGDEFLKRFFAPPRYKERGAGSGFILSQDGYIVTNNHVIEGAQKITVKLVDGRIFKAKIIGTDPFSDVALLKIEATRLPTLTLGNSDLLRIGEWVIAIGNPFGLTHTITVGVISAKGRSGIGISDIEDFIQTDAAINPGNSGGPLLNLKGEVIGMNTAIFTRSGGYMGIGFAIPINIVKTVVEQLKTKGKVERGWLGVVIQDLNPTLVEELGLKVTEGVVITEVVPDSPAAKAGLKEKDVIVALNKKPIKNASELRSYILLTKPGTEVVLDVVRNGQRLEIKVVVEAPKKNVLISRGELEQLNNLLEEFGFIVSDITPEIQKRYNLPSSQGVVVVEVIPESPADYAGLFPGIIIDEVNKRKIKNLREFYQALKPSLQTKKILLGLKTRYGRRYIPLQLE